MEQFPGTGCLCRPIESVITGNTLYYLKFYFFYWTSYNQIKMSIVKSSVINLYDGVSGDHHFQSKVSSDRVDVQVATLPLNIKGTSINLTNEGGNSIQDVVETMLATKQSVVDETAARGVAVANEASARSAADASLQNAINQEASDRSTAMIAETAVRVAAEDALDVKITEEKGARQAAVAAEILARSGADTVLQTNVDAVQTKLDSEVAARVAADGAELTARSAADAVLQSNLDAEANTRATDDATLQTAIQQEQKDRTEAVLNEADARVAADTTLQSNIDAERDLRIEDDEVLQTNITNEAQARQHFDALEATARSDADNALAASVNAEKVARLAEVKVERERIDALLEGTGVDLNQLKELVTAYTTSDANILAQIGLINTNIAGIQAQLDGTDAALNTLIANIQATPAVPAVPGDGYAVSVRNNKSNTFLYIDETNAQTLTWYDTLVLGDTVRLGEDTADYVIDRIDTDLASVPVRKYIRIEAGQLDSSLTNVALHQVKHAAYIMSDQSKLGDYNRITFANLDGSGNLSEAQMDAVVGSSFTIGSDSTVYQITENNNSFKLLTNIYVGAAAIGSYIYLA